MKEPKITIRPVILEVLSSNPKPKSQNKCLISLKILNKKDQTAKIIINLPKNVFKKF